METVKEGLARFKHFSPQGFSSTDSLSEDGK
jgi:hypothetical protein